MKTKKWIATLLTLIGLLGFDAWRTGSVAYGEETIKEREVTKERVVTKEKAPFPEEKVVVVEVEPPAARKDVIVETERPSPDAVFLPGYWARRGDEWVWVKGVWAVGPEKSAVWMPGHWEKKDREWHWVPGHWKGKISE